MSLLLGGEKDDGATPLEASRTHCQKQGLFHGFVLVLQSLHHHCTNDNLQIWHISFKSLSWNSFLWSIFQKERLIRPNASAPKLAIGLERILSFLYEPSALKDDASIIAQSSDCLG